LAGGPLFFDASHLGRTDFPSISKPSLIPEEVLFSQRGSPLVSRFTSNLSSSFPPCDLLPLSAAAAPFQPFQSSFPFPKILPFRDAVFSQERSWGSLPGREYSSDLFPFLVQRIKTPLSFQVSFFLKWALVDSFSPHMAFFFILQGILGWYVQSPF